MYLCTRITKICNQVDLLAQLVEHIPFKDGVLGSNPKQITKDGFRGILIKYPSFRLYTCTCVPIQIQIYLSRDVNTLDLASVGPMNLET